MDNESPTIGSSDIASILGLSAWSSPMQTWARLTGLVARYDSNQTKVTTRGNRMEAALVNWRNEDIGAAVPVYRGPVIGRDKPWTAYAPYEWAHSRPDAWYGPDDAPTLIEAKTVRRFDDDEWGAAGSADIPAYYLAQVLWQMGTARLGGRPVVACDLVAFSPMSEDYRVYVIPYDDARFRALLAKVDAWRQRHVIGGEPPPVDGHDATTAILARVYPGGIARKEVEPSDADIVTARRLRTVKDQIEALEAEATLLGNTLRERIGQAGATSIKGVGRWIPTAGRVTLDAKALEAADPETFRRYAKTGATYRAFTLTIAKED